MSRRNDNLSGAEIYGYPENGVPIPSQATVDYFNRTYGTNFKDGVEYLNWVYGSGQQIQNGPVNQSNIPVNGFVPPNGDPSKYVNTPLRFDSPTTMMEKLIKGGLMGAAGYAGYQGLSGLLGDMGSWGVNPRTPGEFDPLGFTGAEAGNPMGPGSGVDAMGGFPQASIGGGAFGRAGAAAGAAGSGLLGTLKDNAGLIGLGLTGAGLVGSQFNRPDLPADPNFIGAANAQGEASRKAAEQAAMLSNPNINTPYGSQQVTWTRDAQGNLIPNINQQLAPAQQALLDQQNQLKTNLGNTALKGMDTVNQTMSTKFNPSDYGVGGVQSQINMSGMPPIQNQLDMSGVAKMPVNAGTTGQAAIMSRLQPQIERERQQQETQLRNQGLVAGGEAYNNAMNIQGQRENDLLSQASLYGLNLDFNANQQGYNQALGQGNFANQAQNQGFNQAAAQGQFANQAQNQGFSQALTQRQLPINETNALMTGSQVSNPQFQQFQGQSFQGAPLFNATGQQAQYNQGLFGLNQANNNAFMTGLGSLGAGIASAPKGSIFNP